MSMGAGIPQALIVAALAALTTIATTSATYHLLSRPWCIQVDSIGQQTVLYGERQCLERRVLRSPSHATTAWTPREQ